MKTHFVALVLLALSACGGSEPPHSDYYVVTFEPARSELPAAGRTALAYATRDADRGAPRAIAIKAYVGLDGAGRDLSEQRIKVVADALVESGVPRNIIRFVPQTTSADEFARLGNGVVVQVERGEAVVSQPPLETPVDE